MDDEIKFEFTKPSVKLLKPDPEKIATELKHWVKRETSISLCDFCYAHGYGMHVITRLRKTHEDFYHTFELVKMKLAERRERLLNAGLLEKGTFHRHQGLFDPFLHEFEEEKREKEANRKAGIIRNEQANLVTLAKLAAEGNFNSK